VAIATSDDTSVQIAAELTALPRRPGMSSRTERRLSLSLMTAPALGWYAFFMVLPAISMVVVSFLDWPGLLATSSFTGISNYQKMFGDPTFWAAVKNSGVQILIDLVILVPVSFMLGYYLTLKPRGHRILRVPSRHARWCSSGCSRRAVSSTAC